MTLSVWIKLVYDIGMILLVEYLVRVNASEKYKRKKKDKNIADIVNELDDLRSEYNALEKRHTSLLYWGVITDKMKS